MPKRTRREFIREVGSAAATASFATPWLMAESAQGANDRIGIGFIGTGGRGGNHIDHINELVGEGLVQPIAVQDVYRPRLIDASQRTGNARMYDTHEELLADKDVDVVCIASPDRHHAQQTIDAMNAGKDVYCEKPLTHWEQFEAAKEIERVSKATGRLVQVGTQYMADDNYPKIIELIRDGVIGKPVHATCSYFRRGDWGERMPIPDPDAMPGPDLNWERFLGDAPPVDYSVSRFFQWRLFWDYAGGPATDLLVHIYSPVFCILELDYPTRVFGGGGNFQYDREVPDQCNIIADYPDGPTVVMTNSLSNHVPLDTQIRGTDGFISWGMLAGGRDTGVRIVPFGDKKEEIRIPWSGNGDTVKLWRNLLECTRTRVTPMCPIQLAVRVQAPLSMGILSHRENRVAMFDFENESIRMN